jgi:hypothetical protein
VETRPKTTFEVKEHWGGGNLGIPENYPWDVDLIVGIVYPVDAPTVLLTQDAAYDLSKTGEYCVYDRRTQKWTVIGGPGDFVRWLAEVTDKPGRRKCLSSWPETFPNHRKFGKPEAYQIHPYRELIRRHFDQKVQISDYDFYIDDAFNR